MPDLYSTVGVNAKKFVKSQSDAGRELVVKIVDSNSALTDANLYAIMQYITTSHGVSGSGDSAFTVAGFGTADGSAFVSGTTDTVFLRLQGTGSLTVADADLEISGVTVSVVAVFEPAL